MNKSLLLSLAAATLLSTNIQAQSMYEKFHAMELEMKQMKKELATLKSTRQNGEERQTNVSADEDESMDSEDSQDEDSQDDEEMNVQEEILDMQESISELNKATYGNHLKIGIDYRFAVDNLQYKMADGSTQSNDAFMTSRLWMNMSWAATQNLSFVGQLAYNKAFGQRSSVDSGYNFETFDWVASENPYSDTLRVRTAYFLYRNDSFLGSDVPWTFSVGRRPSTNGHLINLRDDDQHASPMGHTINVEFDGASSKFNFDEWVDGMYVKLCAGRGMTNATEKFTPTPYVTDSNTNSDIDLIGLIFVPYDDGQYGLATQYTYASNLIDQVFDPATGAPTQNFDTVGGLHSFTANVTVNGIGDEINDYLDDSLFFLSWAVSKTDPKDGAGGMLGSTESKLGYSAWAGVQMPSFISDDGRWGLEYNYGTKYWRSITYGEDTNVGSKVATRGDAYEAYFTEYLVEDILSLQLRYTYIDYKYSGSNGFFGNTTGSAIAMENVAASNMGGMVVDTAQDVRFYLRYKY